MKMVIFIAIIVCSGILIGNYFAGDAGAFIGGFIGGAIIGTIPNWASGNK